MATVMGSVPDKFLKKVDQTARAQGRSRSELIRGSRGNTNGTANPERVGPGVLPAATGTRPSPSPRPARPGGEAVNPLALDVLKMPTGGQRWVS